MRTTPLYQVAAGTAAGPPVIDIVAVHGLQPSDGETGHDGPWTATRGGVTRHWLRDDLPKDIPNARIFSYSYASLAALTRSQTRFVEEASELLECLDMERAECQQRPLIFLSHSMGGLLVKQALYNSCNSEAYSLIGKSTRGLIFLGTPHAVDEYGLSALGRLCAAISQSKAPSLTLDAVKVIKSGSIYAQTAGDAWRAQLESCRFVLFHGGMDNQLVTPDTMSLGTQDQMTKSVKLDCDLDDMCRFATTEAVDQFNYRKVVHNLRLLRDAAVGSQPAHSRPEGHGHQGHTHQAFNKSKSAKRARAASDASSSSIEIVAASDATSSIEVVGDSARITAEETNFMTTVDRSRRPRATRGGLPFELGLQHWILPSFLKAFVHFDYVSAFQELSRGRYPSSGRWLFKMPQYTNWMADEESRLLWLTGPPGIGKTSLLSYMVAQLRGQSDKTREVVLYSFCRHDVNYTASMVISLMIHQMLIQFPHLQNLAFESDRWDCLGGTNPGRMVKGKNRSPHILWSFLRNLVKDSKVESAVIILDGLDQCEEDSQEMLAWQIDSLFTNPIKDEPRFKVIVSSRLTDKFSSIRMRWESRQEDTYGDLRFEDYEMHIAADIRSYVAKQVQVFKGYSPSELRTLLQKIADVNYRSFLPVVSLMKRLEVAGQVPFETALQNASNELHPYLTSIIAQLPVAVRSQPSLLLSVLAYSIGPLKLRDLAYLVRIYDAVNTGAPINAKPVTTDELEHTKSQLLFLAPLVEINSNNDRVSFFHDTAQEFVLGRTYESDYGVLLLPAELTHQSLAIACLQTIKAKEAVRFPNRWEDAFMHVQGLVSQHVFLNYAFKSWHQHLTAVISALGPEGSVDPNLLAAVKGFVDIWNNKKTDGLRVLILSSFGIKDTPDTDVHKFTPLEVLSALGLAFFLRIYINRVVNSDRTLRPDAGGALRLAIKGGHEDVVELLLDHFSITTLEGSEFQNVLADSAWSGKPNLVARVLRLRRARHDEVVNASAAAFLKGQREILDELMRDRSTLLDRNHFGMTSLHTIFVYWKDTSGSATVALSNAAYYVENGMNINERDDMGFTPLHHACWNRETSTVDVIEGLIKLGADPHARSRGGLTPLHLAARYTRHPEVIKLLVKYGTRSLVGAASLGLNTAIHWGVYRWFTRFDDVNIPVIKELLRSGADLNAVNALGAKPVERLSSWTLQDLYSGLDGITLIAIEPPPGGAEYWLWEEWDMVGDNDSGEFQRFVRALPRIGHADQSMRDAERRSISPVVSDDDGEMEVDEDEDEHDDHDQTMEDDETQYAGSRLDTDGDSRSFASAREYFSVRTTSIRIGRMGRVTSDEWPIYAAGIARVTSDEWPTHGAGGVGDANDVQMQMTEPGQTPPPTPPPQRSNLFNRFWSRR